MEMPLHRPVARRNFEITPASTDSSHPPSPAPEAMNPELLMDRRNESLSPSRTRSILNLTTSTLFGIYSNTNSEPGREELSTPWGTGAQTPSQRRSIDGSSPIDSRNIFWNDKVAKPQPRPRRRRSGFRGYYVPLAMQTVLLFGFGVAYGSIVTQLQEKQKITPIPVPGVERNSVYYHVVWGIIGIILGNALPLLDNLWDDNFADDSQDARPQLGRTRSSSDQNRGTDNDLGPIWYSAVRSIGAFVGIAFAVVSITWSCTRGES